MSLRRFLFAALVAVAAMSGPAWATNGDTVLYGGAGQGRVTFDGRVHAAKGFVCNDCHLSLFTTQKRSLITMNDHMAGTACFACHDGRAAFKTCGGCHRKIDGGPMSVNVFMTPPPRQKAPAKPAAAEAAAGSQPAPTAHHSLTYEGATTIGTRILPEAVKAFAAKTGIPFATIGGAGAGAGFKAVVEGRVAIGGLASEMSAEQKAQVAVSEVIGYDVMGVFVNPKNSVKNLTLPQLREIFTGRLTRWSQLGGPDKPIAICSESLTGGRATVKAFQDMVLPGEKYGPLTERDDATDCIEEVAKDEAGIAASSLSFATPQVATLKVNGAPPSREAVQSGAYPLKRPLILVAQRPDRDVQAFLDFMLTKEAQDIVAKNFVPLK